MTEFAPLGEASPERPSAPRPLPTRSVIHDLQIGSRSWPAMRRKRSSSRKSCAQPARAGSLLLGSPPLRQIFLGQRRSGRLGLHHDARNSPAVGFFDCLNAVDAARDLLALALQRVAAP